MGRIRFSKRKIFAFTVLVVVCLLSFRFFLVPQKNDVNTITYGWDGNVFSVRSDNANIHVSEGESGEIAFAGSRERIGQEAKTIKTAESDLIITAPALATSLFISSESGTVTVSGIHAEELGVASLSGNVDVASFEGDIFSASSSSGNINVSAINASKSVHLSSMSGTIEGYATTAGELVLENSSGETSFTIGSAAEVKAESISGDIKLFVDHPWDYQVYASTATGEASEGDNFNGLRPIRVESESGNIRVE